MNNTTRMADHGAWDKLSDVDSRGSCNLAITTTPSSQVKPPPAGPSTPAQHYLPKPGQSRGEGANPNCQATPAAAQLMVALHPLCCAAQNRSGRPRGRAYVVAS